MIGEKFTLLQYSVSGILGLIETEQFVIPEIQRPFVWKRSQVRDLIDSLYITTSNLYEKYSPDKKGEEEIPPGSYSVEQILGEKNYPESEKNARHGGRAVLHSTPPENGA